MPILTPGFRPPAFLRNGHLQTILPALLPRPRRALSTLTSCTRERLELPDGDFLDLDWMRAPTGNRRLAILSHGLEGDSRASYIRGMAGALGAAGWDALAWTFRGCGPEPNRLLRFYHSGETADLGAVIGHAAGANSDYQQIALVGFSLGGNLTLKHLGEAAPHPAIAAAVAISVPVDLAASTRALDQRWGNRVYLRRFLQTLMVKVESKARRFPAELDTAGLRRMGSFREFDDRYTARLHGFRDAEDYWRQSSSRQFLPGITVPTLLINALDDPFLPAPECFPFPEARASDVLFFEAPAHGGHVGFVDFRGPRRDQTWAERRAVEFLGAMTNDQ